jgi:hypothetical protein
MQLEFIHSDAKNRKLTDVDRRTIRRISRKVGAAASKEKLLDSKAATKKSPKAHVAPVNESLELIREDQRDIQAHKKVNLLYYHNYF